jgi:hypothetical protein
VASKSTSTAIYTLSVTSEPHKVRATSALHLIHDRISGDALTKNTTEERLGRRDVITRVLRHLTNSQTASAVTYNLTNPTQDERHWESKEGKDHCKIW